jgi:DNA polymerase-3 subunit chi
MPERVDFYVLKQADMAALLGFACVVAAKAWGQGMRVYLQVDSASMTRTMDEMLWSFQSASFVPHACFGTPEARCSPVLIGREPAPEGWRRMLVSLTGTLPEGASSCTRVADFIAGDDESHRLAGRERYKAWCSMGIKPDTHEITL